AASPVPAAGPAHPGPQAPALALAVPAKRRPPVSQEATARCPGPPVPGVGAADPMEPTAAVAVGPATTAAGVAARPAWAEAAAGVAAPTSAMPRDAARQPRAVHQESLSATPLPRLPQSR